MGCWEILTPHNKDWRFATCLCLRCFLNICENCARQKKTTTWCWTWEMIEMMKRRVSSTYTTYQSYIEHMYCKLYTYMITQDSKGVTSSLHFMGGSMEKCVFCHRRGPAPRPNLKHPSMSVNSSAGWPWDWLQRRCRYLASSHETLLL